MLELDTTQTEKVCASCGCQLEDTTNFSCTSPKLSKHSKMTQVLLWVTCLTYSVLHMPTDISSKVLRYSSISVHTSLNIPHFPENSSVAYYSAFEFAEFAKREVEMKVIWVPVIVGASVGFLSLAFLLLSVLCVYRRFPGDFFPFKTNCRRVDSSKRRWFGTEYQVWSNNESDWNSFFCQASSTERKESLEIRSAKTFLIGVNRIDIVKQGVFLTNPLGVAERSGRWSLAVPHTWRILRYYWTPSPPIQK